MENKETRNRENKGRNIAAIPESFCVVDIETTGLSSEYDEIIEISVLKVSSLSVVDQFSSLVKPSVPVDDFIENLTGINNDMLSSAPSIDSVMDLFLSFIGDSVLLGYNVNFDINFLYDRSDGRLSNNYVDTMRLFRRAHSGLPHYRLSDFCSFYKVDNLSAHRALSDCQATFESYLFLREDILSSFGGIQKFLSVTAPQRHDLRAKDIVSSRSSFDEDHPLFGKVVVFTGALEKMQRKDAMQIVADFGGINGDSVTKETNYLVLGNNDYCSGIKGGKSNKHKKAESYKLKGNDIEIIPESVFYDMISDSSESDSESGSVPSYTSDPSLRLSPEEERIVGYVLDLIKKNKPGFSVSVERRSSDYVSVCLGYNDFLRLKYTSRAKWLSIDAWGAGLNDTDPLYDLQTNKNQRHWKASLSSVNDISKFDSAILAACKQ
jgi:DNA polymerase-3 subunit epsilon